MLAGDQKIRVDSPSAGPGRRGGKGGQGEELIYHRDTEDTEFRKNSKIESDSETPCSLCLCGEFTLLYVLPLSPATSRLYCLNAISSVGGVAQYESAPMTSIDRSRKHEFAGMGELYDRARPSYPPPLFSQLHDHFNFRAGQTTLEIGCGTGKATEHLAVRGLTVTGIDIAPDLLEVANGKLKGWKVRLGHPIPKLVLAIFAISVCKNSDQKR
jgi:hypothetical protein